jgi:hypothetical protein
MSDSRFGRAMTELSELQKNFQRFYDEIRALLEAEYHRGERDATARIMQAAKVAAAAPGANGMAHEVPPLPGSRPAIKERAPKGTARSLIDRVLTERGPRGAAPSEIMEAAAGVERLASFSGIRFALEQGRDEHRYRNKNGKWYRVIPRLRINVEEDSEDAELPRDESR